MDSTTEKTFMEKLVTELQQGFVQMQTDVKDIKTFLLGNPFTEDKGHVHKVADHETRLLQIEGWKDYEIKTGADKREKASRNISLGLFIFAGIQALQAIIILAAMFYKK